MEQQTLYRIKRTLLVLGLTLIVGTVLLSAFIAAGIWRLPETIIAGESSVHSIARVAICGCLLAALGSVE